MDGKLSVIKCGRTTPQAVSRTCIMLAAKCQHLFPALLQLALPVGAHALGGGAVRRQLPLCILSRRPLHMHRICRQNRICWGTCLSGAFL